MFLSDSRFVKQCGGLIDARKKISFIFINANVLTVNPMYESCCRGGAESTHLTSANSAPYVILHKEYCSSIYIFVCSKEKYLENFVNCKSVQRPPPKKKTSKQPPNFMIFSISI